MKEMIVVTTHTGGGGIGRYICGLVNSLASRGWKIKVYCLKHQNNEFVGNPNITVQSFKIIRRLPRLIKYYTFAKRVLYLTRNSNLPILSSVRIFNPSIMIVGGVHETYINGRNKRKSLYDRLEIHLEKTAYKNTKHIIAHSPLMLGEIGVYSLNVEDKIHMIYPPVSTNTFKYTSKEEKIKIRQKLGLPENKFLIVAAGTCDQGKGVPLIVEAIKQLPQDQFYLMIFGSHYNKPLPKNAKHFGEVRNLQDYFAAADCTLIPSKYEAFGLVVVESLQSGTPVIISKEVGSKKLVGGSEGIILNDRTPGSIKNALIEMRNNPCNVKPDFVERANLTWDYHTDEVEKLLRSS